MTHAATRDTDTLHVSTQQPGGDGGGGNMDDVLKRLSWLTFTIARFVKVGG